ncbi:S8 family serine peptidase [Streptomyces sp. SCUT-3]|uniref:S8 family peptidase n=1 Tax=Streptomyces sp. SCUT-3 TaxID=2684469 RepID=UPI000CC4D0AC|nr:S8 family serine peptidase [Streptomyces sp. SCUT-3]PLW74181.1 serine protease [Streptomyces sp. DJ]QMV23052.1 S8 family serine peptidase [Streptomyces sp. SCUT-3]
MSTVSAPPAGSALTWSLRGRGPEDIRLVAGGGRITPEAAWGGSTGAGVRVCVVDTGVERDHPAIGTVDGSYVAVKDGDGVRIEETDTGDTCGHGTACAGIIRRAAPDCELYSVRVLGERFSGTGDVLLAGLRWAVEQRFDVINLSLSTTRSRFVDELRVLADEAYFGRTVVVASAHNTPVESFPWRFSSVVSVGSHEEDAPDLYLYNPSPPVEFFAPGQNVTVPWLGGTTIRTTGNSFATPFITGLCARVMSKHPNLTPFQVKTMLYLSAANVRTDNRGDS